MGDSKLGRKENLLPEPVAGVSLRPNDLLAKKIPSTGIETRNVLVKVTVPKRTGRRRRRGTDQPFETAPQPLSEATTAPHLLRRLQDHEGQYEIKAVGMLGNTHRFRTMPDFQLRNSELPIMRELRDHVMVPDYESLSRFDPENIPGIEDEVRISGPPNFAHVDIPYKYEYQQAPGVVVVPDAKGNMISKNLHGPARKLTWALPPDIAEIPQGPPAKVPITSPDGVLLPQAIKSLKELLEKRPLVTKRVALNAIPPVSESIFKEATQFVGYSFNAGPWRDTLIRYGVDPRSDPKYRFYQTLMFQVDKDAFKASAKSVREWSRTVRPKAESPNSHIFDGKSVSANGKTWQICDITDPLLHEIFQTENIRTECDVHHWGWYCNGTLSKARAIMKDKMKHLFAGETPDEDAYRLIAGCPDDLHQGNVRETMFPERKYGRNVARMSMDLRAIAKANTAPGTAALQNGPTLDAQTDNGGAGSERDDPGGDVEEEDVVSMDVENVADHGDFDDPDESIAANEEHGE